MIVSFFIILNHFFADFFCQTSKMATRKSTSNKWLTVHAITYIIAMSPIALYMNYSSGMEGWWWKLGVGGIWWLINLPLHWWTDYCTSRLTGFLYKKHLENPILGKFLGESWMHWFFVVVGGDQVIHYFCLFFTYQYLKPF